jgi:hypothetical protein
MLHILTDAMAQESQPDTVNGSTNVQPINGQAKGWVTEPARFFVASGHGGGWLIFREGHSRPVQRVYSKVTAVETARAMARQNAPSLVLVELEDGAFQARYEFGIGGEPVLH